MEYPKRVSSNKKFCDDKDLHFTHTSSLIGKTIAEVKQTDQGLCWQISFDDDTYLIIDTGKSTPAMILYPIEPDENLKRTEGLINLTIALTGEGLGSTYSV